MATRDFLLPDLGEGLEEAEIVSWRVTEGQTVALNQPLAEVETAKAVVEIPSPFAGVVAKLHAGEGEVVRVGSPLVTFELDAPAPPAAEPEPPGERPEAPEPSEGASGASGGPRRQAVLVGYGPPPEEEPSETSGDGRGKRGRAGGKVAATPVVRKLAKELGVDLASVRGSGPGGRVTREDVEAAAARGGRATAPSARAGAAPFPPQERVAVRGVRRTVAEHMARSYAEIPHVTTFLSVDFTWVLALREELKNESSTKVTPLAVVATAAAAVARQHRKLNSTWDAERKEIVLRGAFHLGVATDTERGLLVPVVKDADTNGIVEVAARIAEVVEAARSAQATPEQLTGSTFTISNVGSFGAEFGTPIINHPEAAILALGVIEQRPVVADGEVVVRPVSTLALSFDHRVMDGAEAGRALKALGEQLESPFRLGALPR